jgi:hypothetical protein
MSQLPKSKIIRAKKTQEVEIPKMSESDKDAAIRRAILRKSLNRFSDMAAGDSYHFVKHYYPGGKQLFPNSIEMHTCDKFYPHADGGPLWIDEERGNDSRDFKAKKEAMQKLGHRYLVITRNMTELDVAEFRA